MQRRWLALLVIGLLTVAAVWFSARPGPAVPTGSPSAGGTPSGSGGTPAGHQGEPAPPSPPPGPQEAVLNLGTDPATLDPHRATDPSAYRILHNVMEGLVRLGDGGRVEQGSGLAAEWTVSPDGLTYTFVLREGLTWSDGRPLTAHDFVYAWTRALDPRVGSPHGYLFYPIAGAETLHRLRPEFPDFDRRLEEARARLGIRAVDERTLQVTLRSPAAHFPALTASPAFLPLRQDVVEAYGERFGREAGTMVFNGPFRIARWDPGRQLVLEKNPWYWDAGRVQLDRVTWQMLTDANAVLGRFAAGELDLAEVPAAAAERFQDRGLQPVVRGATFYVALNIRHPLLKHPSIRQALALAIDRTRLAAGTSGGQAATGLVPPGIPGATAPYRTEAGDILPPAGDPARAQALFASGLRELQLDPAGLPVLGLLVEDNPTAVRHARTLQDFWQQQLGLRVEVVPVERRERLERVRLRNFDMVLSGWVADYSDPMAFLAQWVSTSPFNDAHWTSAEYDRWIARAGHAAGPQERMEALIAAEKILLTELPVMPLYHPVTGWVLQSGLRDVRFPPVGGDVDLKLAHTVGRP